MNLFFTFLLQSTSSINSYYNLDSSYLKFFGHYLTNHNGISLHLIPVYQANELSFNYLKKQLEPTSITTSILWCHLLPFNHFSLVNLQVILVKICRALQFNRKALSLNWSHHPFLLSKQTTFYPARRSKFSHNCVFTMKSTL